MKQPRYTVQQFHRQFKDNKTCLLHLFETHHGHKACPKCGEKGKYHLQADTSHFVCQCGKHQISPKAGTIFEKSDTDLVKWYFAIFLMSQSRNGVAAKEIERHTGVTYKTAWRMAKEIRKMMDDPPTLQTGEVEADETWIGGRKDPRRKNAKKTIVFGSVQRKGKVQAQVVKDVTEESLLHPIRSNVAKGSLLLTDQLRAYRNIAHIEGYGHETVKHQHKEYRKGNAYTNTIEGFWSQLKRSLDGTYHVISPKYLPLYLGEFAFRYNYARDPSFHLFDFLLSRVGLPHVLAVQRIASCR
ncbi:MAG: ISSpo3, transposase [Candidatus Peregrinibacteria bacterium Greene1014_49]|nr:MAG: ISSpo3, transposase [Candidatus Peregrinibacteria bacterium Greene1014_49]